MQMIRREYYYEWYKLNYISHRTKERSNTLKQKPHSFGGSRKTSQSCAHNSMYCNRVYRVRWQANLWLYSHFFRLYLKCILSVIQAINPDVIIQSCARDGPKNSQLEPLGGCFANRLAHQAVSPQCLRQNMTCLWVHLHIAGRGEVLLSHYNHVLLDPNTHTNSNTLL